MTSRRRTTGRRASNEDHATIGASYALVVTNGLLRGSLAACDSIPCPSTRHEKPKPSEATDRLVVVARAAA
jgi:hypothetical protein